MAKLTQTQKENYLHLYNSSWDTLNSAYQKPSQAKRDAYQYICTISANMDGTLPRVISHNTFHFTTAFKFWRQGNPILRVDTATNIYMFDMISLEDYEGR